MLKFINVHVFSDGICANGVEQAAHHDIMSQPSLLHSTLSTLGAYRFRFRLAYSSTPSKLYKQVRIGLRHACKVWYGYCPFEYIPWRIYMM